MNNIIKICIMKWLCLVLFAMSASPVFAVTDDVDDPAPEESRIFYTIQKGDTLWDLSEQFFGSPWIWPELWQQNKEIPNPHLIYPGKRIRLFQEDWRYPPPEPAEEEVVQTEEGKIELPETESTSLQQEATPITEPQTISEYFSFFGIDSIGYLRIEDKKERAKNRRENFKQFDRPYIYKSQKNKIMISERDIVYITDPAKEPMDIGNKYSIYRIREFKDKENDYVGTEYLLVGVAEITATNAPGFYEANILHSYRDIKQYDQLMPYTEQLQDSNLTYPENPVDISQISGKMIAAEDNREIFGISNIAYINKGASDGVMGGQKYVMYYQEKFKDTQTGEEILLNPVIYGAFIVVMPKQNTSTVIITKSDKSIKRGSLFKAK